MICRHCEKEYQARVGRGLCRPCWKDEEIRSQYAQVVERHKEKHVAMMSLAAIRLDGGTQTRTRLNLEVVKEYADLYRDGRQLPPVVVFFDGFVNWLADGFHRVDARQEAGFDDVEIEVLEGTQADALWYACGANQAHGLRRCCQDKHLAVRKALEVFGGQSNQVIAEHCGVSWKLVNDMRQCMVNGLHQAELDLKENWSQPEAAQVAEDAKEDKPYVSEASREEEKPLEDGQPPPVYRVGKDGRCINVANIGKRRPPRVVCDRCQRVGKVKDCSVCAGLNEAPSITNPQRRDPTFSFREYDLVYGGIEGQPEVLYRAFGKLSPSGEVCRDAMFQGLQRLLEEFDQSFRAAYQHLVSSRATGEAP